MNEQAQIIHEYIRKNISNKPESIIKLLQMNEGEAKNFRNFYYYFGHRFKIKDDFSTEEWIRNYLLREFHNNLIKDIKSNK